MADDPFKEALKKSLWAQFQTALAGLRYTPTPNTRLEAKIKDSSLELEERFDALLERKSLGHWSLFACERNWETGEATPLNQTDFARILHVDKRRINAVVKLRRKQGYLTGKDQLTNVRLLAPVLDPVVPSTKEPPREDPPWSDFSQRWDADHADQVRRKKELRAAVAPLLDEIAAIEKAKLDDFNKAREASAKKAPGAGPSADFLPTPVPDFWDDKSDSPTTAVPDSPDEKSATSPTLTVLQRGEAIGIDSRAREELKSKQNPTTTNQEVVVIAQSLTRFGGITSPAARKFLESCRKEATACTAEDIVAVVNQVGRTITSGVVNPVGLLLKTVPLRIAAYCAAKPTAQVPAEPTTREQQIASLALAMEALEELPGSVSAAEWRQELVAAEERDPQLYGEARRIYDAETKRRSQRTKGAAE